MRLSVPPNCFSVAHGISTLATRSESRLETRRGLGGRAATRCASAHRASDASNRRSIPAEALPTAFEIASVAHGPVKADDGISRTASLDR